MVRKVLTSDDFLFAITCNMVLTLAVLSRLSMAGEGSFISALLAIVRETGCLEISLIKKDDELMKSTYSWMQSKDKGHQTTLRIGTIATLKIAAV